MPKFTFMCTLCEKPVPRGPLCSMAAVGYDKLWDGFAELSEHRYSCPTCPKQHYPQIFDRKLLKQETQCDFCKKDAKKISTRLRLNIPPNLEDRFLTDKNYLFGCYECVGKRAIDILNQRFEHSTSRLSCPTCRKAKGGKTLVVAKFVAAGSRSHGDLVVTCKKCFDATLGWFPIC